MPTMLKYSIRLLVLSNFLMLALLLLPPLKGVFDRIDLDWGGVKSFV